MARWLHSMNLASTAAGRYVSHGGGSKGIGTKLLPCTSGVFPYLVGSSEPLNEGVVDVKFAQTFL